MRNNYNKNIEFIVSHEVPKLSLNSEITYGALYLVLQVFC